MEPSEKGHGKVSCTRKPGPSNTPSSNAVTKPSANEYTRGKSSTHGSSYHLRLAMVLMLRAIILRRKGKLFNFKLTMEDPNAGKFDDIVFRYSLPSTPEEFASVYIQAKHKQTSDRASITEASLLTKWNSKAPFSIPMYFVSYLHGYDKSLEGSHTYILCTNATLENYIKQYFTPRHQETDTILSFCDDIGATCYSFISKTEFKALKNELRTASLEKLGQMIALYVYRKWQIKSNIYMFNISSNLIAKCVKLQVTGIFQFHEDFRNADESTFVGKLRCSFEQEYLKLTRKKEVNWEDVRIMTDQSLFESISNNTHRSMYDERQYYEAVDVVIQQFFEKFMFICGSKNETELFQTILDIMPSWVSNPESTYNSLHSVLFDSMSKSSDINWQYLKQHFIEKNTNAIFNRVQTFTNEYFSSMRAKYSHMIVQSKSLEDTALNYFMSSTSFFDVYRYRCTTNLHMNALTVSQTSELHQQQCLFVNSTSSTFKDNFSDAVCELMEFLTAVDLSTQYIITILGPQENVVLKAIRNLAKSYKIHIIIVEAPTEEDPSEDCLFVWDLIEDARKQLFTNRDKFKLFGTITTLDRIVSDDDSLSFLFNVLEKFHQTEMAESLNLKNFETIKSWYIPRTCTPYSEDNKESEKYLVEKKITTKLLQSTISLKEKANRLPDALKNVNNVKVHIFLDEAGYGKSTYFTWLANALSNDDSSLYVIRMNALQYSTDFYQLQAADPKTLDDTEVIRIFYRFLHMTLFVTDVNIRSTKAANEERQRADRIAQFLKVFGGRIILDEKALNESKVPVEELLQLRLFRTKFNERLFVCLLDGFDETAPHYKDFVMKYFARLASFEGIQNLYLSTRPYNFRGELKHTFSGCIMWRLEPFSQSDRILFLNNYLEHEMDGYKIGSESSRLSILLNMYKLTINSIHELKIIPLFLHMAVKFSLSKANAILSDQQQVMFTDKLKGIKFDQLQVVSNFVDENLRILNNEKPGAIDHASTTPIQRLRNDEANAQMKRKHSLLAMHVIFDKDDRTKLLADQEEHEAVEFMQEVIQGNEKSGIIRDIQDDIPIFIHRIFAEYFVAFWIYNNRHRMKSDSFFLSWDYWNPLLYQTRDFLNRMIVRDSEQSDIHMAVINQSEKQVREFLSKDPAVAFAKDSVGRQPLHLAAMYPSADVVQLLLEKMPIQSINTTDELFHWTALDYAFVVNYNTTVERLLAAGVVVHQDTLLRQILSNKLRNSLIFAHAIEVWLQGNDDSKNIVRKIYSDLVGYLLKQKHFDILACHEELDSLKVLEFCVKCNLPGLFLEFLLQMNVSVHDINQLSRIASESKAEDVVACLNANIQALFPETKNVYKLGIALKACIKYNHFYLFKHFFHQLSVQCKLHLVDDTDIFLDDYAPSNGSIESFNKIPYPRVCCVRSSYRSNVRKSIKKYSKKDIQHDGFYVETLLATAVHEGNMQMVKYIVQKTNITITNKLIVMVMRMLPRKRDVCHKQSMDAFTYLIERTNDRDSIDDEGRNILHMTSENGCFFMLQCLIAKGFDPAVANAKNGWNVLHYVAFDQDNDRIEQILDLLLKKCDMNWLEDLDRLIESDTGFLNAVSNQITRSTKKLSKQKHALLAMYAIFRKEYLTTLLSYLEQQEAIKCMREVALGNTKTSIIRRSRDDVPLFIHSIFSEYFAATWIYCNLRRVNKKCFFRSWVYWNDTVHRTRDFLNRMILRDSGSSSIHMAVINQSEKQVRALLSMNPAVAFVKDSFGRLPLHVAIMYPSLNIPKMIIEKMPIQSINTKDELFRWTALDYAFALRHGTIANHLITVGAEVDGGTLFDQLWSNGIFGLPTEFYYSKNGYEKWLLSHEHTKDIADRLFNRASNMWH